jgi:hypothetical protein
MKKKILLASIVVVLIFNACSKSEEFKTDTIEDYAPLTVGKYITYQLDSLIFADNIIPFDHVNSYQVKYVVEDTITDNIGRKGFTIRRYINKNVNWVPDNVFMAINSGNSLEFIENNLRFIKLKEPIRNEFSWKGNSSIDTYSANSEVKYFDDWDYFYDSVNTTLMLGNTAIDSTIKVAERDDVLGNPNDEDSYSEINFSVSNYGKGIGMVYHQFLHQEYQPATPGTKGYKIGYGITLTMIEHN